MLENISESITFEYLKNTEKSPNMGSMYAQGVEPHGMYIIKKINDFIPSGWLSGEVTINNPLIISVDENNLVKWKNQLSNKYNLKGKKLTNKLLSLGYDAIITEYPNGDTGEIILFNPEKQIYNKAIEQAKTDNKIELINEITNKPIICPVFQLTNEIVNYVKRFNSSEEFLRKGGLSTEMLDRLAFGFADIDITTLNPKQLSIKWKDDLENVKYEIQKTGLNPKVWASKINLSEPIDVSYEKNKFFIEDGHHRFVAAKILNKPLNVNLEIKTNPITIIAPKLGYDDVMRCIFNQINGNLNETYQINYIKNLEKAPKLNETNLDYTTTYDKNNVLIYVDGNKILNKLKSDSPEFDITNKDNQIGNRVEKAKEFISNYKDDKRPIHPNTGERVDYLGKHSFEPSIASFDMNGNLGFTDGRHRILAAIESGIDKVGVLVPKNQVDMFKHLMNESENINNISCYHTSLEDFNIFDTNKIGSMRNLDNVGFFFTKKEEDAKDFGDLIGRKKQQDFYYQYKCSVKINKPYTFKQFQEDFNGEYKTGYDGNLTSTFDLNKEFILDKIKENNYDGLIFGNLIMCLNPNQIKIIDKKRIDRIIGNMEKYRRTKINETLLTEKLANVDSDVDLLYNKYFKTDIDELNRTGTITKEMFNEYQGDNTNILNSEDSIKANETNRCELIINNRLGNAYRPSTKTIFLSANRNAINYVLNEFNGDYNDALDSLKGGNQYNSFKMEFTEERIKGSIHHELAHWIDDTNNNQHINKRTQIATKLGTQDINNVPVDSTKMEIQGQIHNIKQIYNKYKENWNELSLRDLFNLTPTLNLIFNRLNDSYKKQWLKDLILRMNRENLLGDKMRLNNYYTLNENNNETPNEYIERKKRQIDDEPNYQVFVDRIIKELKNNGLENDYYTLSKSQTTFGQSWYIIFKNGLEIRISNHSVTSNNRILDNKYVAFINVHKKYSDDDIKNIINEYIRLKNIKDEIEYKQQSSFNKLKEIDAKIKNNSLEFIENLKNNKKAIFDSGKTFQTIDTIKEKHPDWENVLQLPYQNGFIYYYIKQNNGYGNYNINKEYYNFLVKNNIINKDMINENTLNEENSDLKGTILKIVSPNIQKHLDDLIKQYGDKAEIIKHIVSAIDDKPEYSLTYEYAKKIKNYFDNFKGNNTSEEYQLHGGIKLKNYINLILAMKRDSISTGKDIRKNMTILNNTHLKSHDKSTIGLTRNPMALKEHIELIENYIPTKKASCGVILNPEKSILLVKRGIYTKWFPGKWALVGGKVDGDEEFKDAFVREVKEETNLDLDFIKYCFNKHDGDCEVALFVAITKTPNDIKINKEHSEYKWCTANEIKELDCVPHIYEDISECLKLITNNKEDLLAEEYKHSEYLSWKRKNVTIRGIKEAGQENNAGAMLGRGLYTAFLSNKELAKQYGTVKFVVNAIPKKPKVFNTLNEWEIFFYNTLIRNYCKEHGLKESRTNFSQNTTIEDEMQKLGFDGIIIKGREMVNYKPENVQYFGNENQLKFYYEDIT